ncbi:MAG: GerAB/ArcD/ProY family transporter, partial [Clostridia bacterium]|nr:GerAB/ArcD/ProY family transporter [Clostridia bacterium]
MAYYTLPASMLLSLLIFVLLAKLIKRSGAGNLSELICQSADRPTGIVITLLLFFALIFSAYSPLSQFLKALHGLFFQGASYSRILLYIMAPVLLICFLGFETIARTAKLLAVPLMIVFLSVIVSASSDFEVYRLFPTAGGGLKSILTQIFREVFTFLPAMISLLTVSDGLNGIDSAIRIGAVSCLISAAVCAAAQLSVGLV